MARSQFTFTFPNAQPGAPVTFSAAVYSSKVDATADGPTLVLDAQRTVAVWTDATELTATWKDGSGASIAAEASLDRPVVTAIGGVPGQPTAASSALSQLVASGAASSGHIKGEDIYPAMTLVASSGSDITLDVDGQTIHCAAGIYDVCVGFRLGSDAPATLGVYVDGLPLHQDLLCEEITDAGNVSGAGGWATALGVVLAAPAALLLNFEMDSASSVNWSITAAQITVRRVGDAPNP